ncbi:competence protein ComK [Litchfieldia alkalitelluris]|uniref:competence protein ComK n=1 Tax=Litchfieldia alkalitelluris TaxID=304268 RepID=UPI001F30C132|nr:competence protein ComK [Litchfieldia alkalitelluris]
MENNQTMEMKRCVEDYEVNPYTMAIVPLQSGRKIYSIVLEKDEEIIVKMKPLDIVDRSCRYFGSSYKGRKEGTRELMGITHKPPIIVEPSHQIFLFPTVSPTSADCTWLSHSHIYSHSTAGNGTTKITFQNKKSMHVNISKGSFENQFFQTAQLRTIITSRMENKDSNKDSRKTNGEEVIFEYLFDEKKYRIDEKTLF